MNFWPAVASSDAKTCHQPGVLRSCADADRATDEQIRLYEGQVAYLLARIEELEGRATTRGCSCRPENGGSGICGCILGGPKVTC